MVQQVLIIHPGGLGDVLLALPAIRALRATYEAAALVLISRSDVGNLLLSCAEVQHSMPLEGPAFTELVARTGLLPNRFCDSIRETDIAVCWLTDTNGHLSRSLRALGVRKVIVQSPFQGMQSFQHQSERFLGSLGNIVGPIDSSGCLQIDSDTQNKGRRMIDALGGTATKTVVLHPGSGSRHKCTAPTLFVNMARNLSVTGYRPIIVGGPADDESVSTVATQLDAGIPVVTGLDLLSMAGLLAHTALFVGHDSGLTHLAATLHRPTVAIFGPTPAERWAPRGKHVKVVGGDLCVCKGWEAVQSCREKPCLQVSAEEVLRACKSLLTQEYKNGKTLSKRDVSPCSSR